MGILTDGKYWYLRRPDGGELFDFPDRFTLDSPEGARDLEAWLSDGTQVLPRSRIAPTAGAIAAAFGGSARGESVLRDLMGLHDANRDRPTVAVKRSLWYDLLAVAVGEAVGSDDSGLDALFVRHTYLTAVVSMAVQSAFGVSIAEAAESAPERLLDGRQFAAELGTGDRQRVDDEGRKHAVARRWDDRGRHRHPGRESDDDGTPSRLGCVAHR